MVFQWSRFWSYLMRGLLQHWIKSSRIPSFKRRSQSGGTWKAQKEDRFLRGRQIAQLDLRIISGSLGSPWFCRELYADLFTSCSSKWWHSGIRFEMGRNFIINDENPTWWHHGNLVQIKNTRVLETQDRIGIVQYGDPSEESWTW